MKSPKRLRLAVLVLALSVAFGAMPSAYAAENPSVTTAYDLQNTDSSTVSSVESYAKTEAESSLKDVGWSSAVVVDTDDEASLKSGNLDNSISLINADDSEKSDDSGDSDVYSALGANTDEIVEKLTTTTESEEFKKTKSSGENPLELNKNQETIAVVQNELLLFQNLRKNSSNQNSAVVFDTMLSEAAPAADVAYQGGFSYKNQIDNIGGRSIKHNFDKAWNFNDGSYDTQNNDINQYSAVKAVACDPFGTGRDSCVAYVGLKCTGANHCDVMTWLYDYKNGKCSPIVNLATLYWSEIDSHLTNAQMSNFMAIAAGNYYGNINKTEGYGFATDSVVVYAPSAGMDKKANGLVEIQWQQDSKTHEITLKSQTDFNTGLLHPGYGYGDGTWAYNGNCEDKLACDLATGDFNADGIEDLAVLSYVGNVKTKTYGDATLYIPYISVSIGNADKKILENKKSGIYFEQFRGVDDGVYLWDTARSPGLAVGDANGDGIDEIAVGGIKVTQGTATAEPNSALKKSDLWYYANEKDNMVVGIYQATYGNIQVQSFTVNVETNKWKQAGVHLDDSILERTGIAFLSLNGQNTQQQLFIDGSIYDFQTGNGIINTKPIKTAKYFDEADNGVGSVSITNTYIQSIAVGNFDNNYAGRQQVMFVIGLKESAAHNDALALLSMGASYADDTTTSGEVQTKNFQNYTSIWDNGYLSRECYLNHCEGSNIKENFSCVVVALDMDDDGLKIKYSDIEYLETDAEVQAVIQAAPYFDGLKQYHDSNSTSYKVVGSYSYETSTSHTDNVEYGGIIGLHAEFPVVEWDVRVKIGRGVSYQTGKGETSTKTYTSAFAATNENIVVIRRNPMYRYTYDYEDAAGKKSRITYDVGQSPYYVQVSVDDYNAIVDEYNAAMKKKETDTYKPSYLYKISESYLSGNIGSPWKYQDKLGGENVRNDYYITNTAVAKGAFSEVPGWVQLGHAAGYTEVSLDDTKLNKTFNTQSTSVTMSAETSFKFKCGIVAGAYVSSSGTDSSSSSTTTGSGTGISTRVGNLNKTAVLHDKVSAEETIDKYTFKWSFAGGEIKIAHNDSAAEGEEKDKYVPLLHHIVTDLAAPVSPVKLNKMSVSKDGDNKITLTWTTAADDGSGRKFYKADEMCYTIYQRNASEDSAWMPVNRKLIVSDCTVVDNKDASGKVINSSLTYTITPVIDIDDGNIYQYAVRCSVIDEIATTESVNSNYKTIALTDSSNAYLHIKYSNDGGKTFTANDGDDVGSWMGIYTDNKAGSSLNVNDYKWAQIKGDTGEKGEKGDKGDPGEKGDKGDTGEQGEKGDKGDTGEQGEKGDKGDTGEQGEKGEKGDTGEQGEKGEKGDTGEQGEKGDKGDTGEQGEKGDKGDTGEQGEKGDKGDTGAAGAKGNKGDTGATGAKGDKGDTGATGATGAKGDKGDTGATGATGDKGDKGDKGDTGEAGRGIISTQIDEEGHLIITYSDDTTEDAGSVRQEKSGYDWLVYLALAIGAAAVIMCIILFILLGNSRKKLLNMTNNLPGIGNDKPQL